MVKAFTQLTFGEGRFPDLKVDGDDKRQDFVGALSRATALPLKMVRCRDIGGSVGTGALSWCYRGGVPRVRVHNPKNFFVHSWVDREEFVPEHVTQVYQFEKNEWVEEKKRFMNVAYWFRRDWATDEDVLFKPVKVEPNKDPVWNDPQEVVRHGDGICHVVWIQNLPTDDEDGDCDYEGEFENFDALDLMLSVILRGGVLNLDPTLVLSMDRMEIADDGHPQGGRQCAAMVGKDGDAKYLELSGMSIEAGLKLFNSKRGSVLETTQCVFPDPDKMAAQGTSSVAMKVVYTPMLGKVDIYRDQYGGGLKRLLDPMVEVASTLSRTSVQVPDDVGGVVEAAQEVKLPKRAVDEPELDGDGQPTGRKTTTLVDRAPGDTGEVDPTWPQYFPPTADDQQKAVTTLTAATGQQAFISRQTATEVAMRLYGRDPVEEEARIREETAATDAKHDAMFADAGGAMGGKVTQTKQLPGGATIRRTGDLGAPPDDEMPTDDDAEGGDGIALAPTDLAAIVTVNEARASVKLPALSGPDGEMTVIAYKAKYAKPVAIAANADLGKTGEPPDADTPPPAPPFGAGGKPPFGASRKPGANPKAGKGAPPFGAKPADDGKKVDDLEDTEGE